MHGRPPRISGRREIRLPISVTVAIDFQYTALMKPGKSSLWQILPEAVENESFCQCLFLVE
jgi:hypothetical protein